MKNKPHIRYCTGNVTPLCSEQLLYTLYTCTSFQKNSKFLKIPGKYCLYSNQYMVSRNYHYSAISSLFREYFLLHLHQTSIAITRKFQRDSCIEKVSETTCIFMILNHNNKSIISIIHVKYNISTSIRPILTVEHSKCIFGQQ